MMILRKENQRLNARRVGCTSNGINLTNNAMSATLTRLFGGEDQDWSNIAATSVGQSLGNGIVQAGSRRPTFTDEQAQQRADVFILNDEALAEKYDPNYRPAPLFADSNLDVVHAGVLDASGLSVAQTRELQQMQRLRDAASQFIADNYVLSNEGYLGKYFPEVLEASQAQRAAERKSRSLFLHDYSGGRAVGQLEQLREDAFFDPKAAATLDNYYRTFGPIALTGAALLSGGSAVYGLGFTSYALPAFTGGVGAVAGGVGSVSGQLFGGGSIDSIDWNGVLVAAGVGAVAGAIAPYTATSYLGAATLGGTANTIQYSLTQVINEQDITLFGLGINAITGIVGGAIAGPISKNTSIPFDTGSRFFAPGHALSINNQTAISINTGQNALLRTFGAGVVSNTDPTSFQIYLDRNKND